MSEPTQPSRSQQPEQVAEKVSLEKIMDREFLKLLTEASSGYSYHEDPNIPPGELGYTNMETRQIFINPSYLARVPKEKLRGFLYHEAGHHDPEVKRFQKLMGKDLDSEAIIPDEYQSPESRTQFVAALHRHLHNCLADIWDESYMGRNPYKLIRKDIDTIYEGLERESLKHLPLPEQLSQLLVGEHRYPGSKPIENLVDPKVYEAYKLLNKSGALDAIEDRQYHESYLLSTEKAKQAAAQKKYDAYHFYILPEYLKLLKKEIEKRKEKKEKRKGKKNKNENGGKGEDIKNNNKEKPQKGEGEGKSSSAPLTDKEIDQIAKELAKELEKLGDKEYGSKASSKEEKKELEDKLNEIKEREETKQEGKEKPEEKNESETKEPEMSAEEKMRQIQKQLERETKKRNQRGLAEAHKVPVEIIELYQRIKDERKEEINNFAAAIYEIFRSDRMSKIDYMRKEGEWTPGLEYETISSLQQGEFEPDTMMDIITNEEFLETEIVFVIDTSGSMSGTPIKKSVEALVVICEAFRQAKELLETEQLLKPNENPLKIGVVGFDTKSNVIHKLDDPIDEAAEINIINKLNATGGGTEDYKALKPQYEQFRLRSPYVLKTLVVLTDGHGDTKNITSLVQQIENDDEALMLVLALGSGAEGIKQSYLKGIRKEKESNVYAVADQNCGQILPTLIEFLRKQVTKKAHELPRG